MAPDLFKKLIRSIISGSIAIFFNLTCLFDKQQFKIAVSVAPTDIFLNLYDIFFLIVWLLAKT